MRAADGEIAGELTSVGPAVVTLTPADLADVGAELATSLARFAPCFARREQRVWAEMYLRGQLLADVPRKNVEAMALRLLGARHRYGDVDPGGSVTIQSYSRGCPLTPRICVHPARLLEIAVDTRDSMENNHA